MPTRRTTVLVRMLGNDAIQTLTIGRHHVLDVGNILQTTLYLERRSTRLSKFLQVGRQV